MDWKDKNHLLNAFMAAIEGFFVAFREERNLKIHFIISIIVINLGFIFNIKLSEWIICLILIGIVIALELVNSAIENVVDLTTNYQNHPLAKKAKDMAAGAVLVMAIVAAIVGSLIFSSYIF